MKAALNLSDVSYVYIYCVMVANITLFKKFY